MPKGEFVKIKTKFKKKTNIPKKMGKMFKIQPKFDKNQRPNLKILQKLGQNLQN